MKKVNRLFALFCFLLVGQFLFALEVNKTEIQSAGGEDAIVFINYTGPHKVINTVEEIKGLGRKPAKNLTVGTSGTTTDGKYTVIRAVDSSEKQGLDADIIILSPSAGVDHIVNLRRIISAYLETSYNYNEADASTLATFITVYNAVYRGNLEAFQKKYKQVVLKYLTANIVGLSTNYEDWPGKTQIVIPISDPNGETISTIDTSVISDKKVVENLQNEDDKSVDVRKDMVDIKEREADDATEKAQQAQKDSVAAKNEADEAKKKQAEEEAKQKQAEADAEKAKKDAELAQKKAEENPDDKEAQKEAEEKQVVAEEKKQEADEQKEKAEEQAKIAEEKSKEADEKSAEATEKQTTADKKRSEAQTERTDIAKDQQDLLKEAEQKQSIKTSYGLKITDKANLLSTLVLVNVADGSIVKESPVTVIRGRIVYPAGSSFIAVAGKTDNPAGSNAAIKLVTLDQSKMEIITESTEIVAPQSVLVESAGYYYVVIQDGTNPNWILGKYSNDLKLQAKSEIAVLPETPVMIKDDTVCVTGVDGLIKVLGVADLKTK